MVGLYYVRPLDVDGLFYWMFKYKGLFTFTAANPGIEDGGLINESKISILEKLMAGGDEAIPYFISLRVDRDRDSWRKDIEQALSNGDLTFPCVLKPDAGQRGTGVVVVEDEATLWRQIKQSKKIICFRLIAQVRRLVCFIIDTQTKKKGKLFSITLKTLPSVTGDGESSIRDLILKDENHVCLSEYLFSILKDRLKEVPIKVKR